MLQPHVPNQSIISLLVQEKLPITSTQHTLAKVAIEVDVSDIPKTIIRLAVSVHIRGFRERPIFWVKEQQTTPSDIDEDSNVSTASITGLATAV